MNAMKNVIIPDFPFIVTHFRLTQSENVLTIAILIEGIHAGMIGDE